MRELDIQPVLQGFYGMVSYSFSKKFPQSLIHDPREWLGFKCRFNIKNRYINNTNYIHKYIPAADFVENNGIWWRASTQSRGLYNINFNAG